MTRTITATELKVKTAEILDDVAFNKTIYIVERNGRPIVKIVPVERYVTTKSKSHYR